MTFLYVPPKSIQISTGGPSPVGDALPWINVNLIPQTDPPFVEGREYKWQVDCTLGVQQTHSSGYTRSPGIYNCMDINVGMWIANEIDGTSYLIIEIISKNDTQATIIVEDIFRYNTYRDIQKNGSGAPVSGNFVVFNISDDGMPVVDNSNSIFTTAAINSLNGRFQYTNLQNNFSLYQSGNTFSVGDTIAVDTVTHTFVKSDSTFTSVIGRVTSVSDVLPGWFTINPVAKIVDFLDYLPGDVGDTIYGTGSVLSTTPGGPALYIKLRNNTQSISISTIANATTQPGGAFYLNGYPITIGGSGTQSDVISAVNSATSQTEITASQEGNFIKFTASDAREINFTVAPPDGFDPIANLGLISVENGIKAAGMYIESVAGGGGGGGGSVVEVVADLAALNALTKSSGKQAYVINSADANGNNVDEWSMWICTGTTWIKTASQDSSQVDARSIEYVVPFNAAQNLTIGKLSTGRRITLITVDVTQAFVGGVVDLTIGYSIPTATPSVSEPAGLMTTALIDLSRTGIYTATSDILFGSDTPTGDVTLTATYTAGGSTAGSAKIIVTYV